MEQCFAIKVALVMLIEKRNGVLLHVAQLAAPTQPADRGRRSFF